MGSLTHSLEELALNPAYHDFFTVAKAARNGAVYGAKIRFPHALVMTFLFGRGTPREKIKFVYKATKQHSTNLMKFASLYKFVTIFMRRTNGGKERSGDSFLAGCLAGYYVFGERNAVNEQVSGRRTLCMS
jgi:peroxisomal membrane protein 4